MATYIMLNLVFFCFALLTLKLIGWLKVSKKTFVSLIILIIATAIFDSLIIHFNIVDYDYSKTLGVAIGKAPMEDFFYAILAAIAAPNMYKGIKKYEAKN